MKRDFRNIYSEQGRTTSWQHVAPWYNKVTRGGEGHYYHQHVVIPGVLRLLGLSPNIQHTTYNILDLACGNGVLAKALPKNIKYTGIDLADSLIKQAKIEDKNYDHRYFVGDVTKTETFTPIQSEFTHAAIILALQNIEFPEKVLDNASKHLLTRSNLVIVLNHPAFRIPRQSSWGIDEGRKIQYRRVDKYMTPMNIPILMNPSDPRSAQTMSYHFPISDYSKMLKDSGFAIELIEEWTSDKESVGRAGRMENRSRAEIPLFMAILATKK